LHKGKGNKAGRVSSIFSAIVIKEVFFGAKVCVSVPFLFCVHNKQDELFMLKEKYKGSVHKPQNKKDKL
jgi:hypothetical protein